MTEPISQSILKLYRRSPAYYRYHRDNPQPATPAQLFGQAYHCWILLPGDLEQQFTLYDPAKRPEPDKTMASNANKAWKAELEARGLPLLSTEDMDTLNAMAAALVQHDYSYGILHRSKSEREHELTGTLEGVPVTGRLDMVLDSGIIVDLKTCSCAEPAKVAKDAADYGYHIQAAFYTDLLSQIDGQDHQFMFIFQEKDPPYQVAVYLASEQFISEGRREYKRLLALHKECCEKNRWPGYEPADGSMVYDLWLPAWAIKD